MRINISSTNTHQPRFSRTSFLVAALTEAANINISLYFSPYIKLWCFFKWHPPIPFHSDISRFENHCSDCLIKNYLQVMSPAPALFIPSYLLWILRSSLTPEWDFEACCYSPWLPSDLCPQNPCWVSAHLSLSTGEASWASPLREEKGHTRWI